MSDRYVRSSESEPTAAPRPNDGLRGKFRAILIAVGLTVVGFVGATALAFASVRLLAGAAVSTVVLFSVSLIATELGYASVAAAYLRRYSSGIDIRAPTRREVGLIALTVGVLFAVQRTITYLVLTGGFEANSTFGEIGIANPTAFLVLGVASILLVGPAEELLFRGAIQGRLRRAFGPVGAIVITSLLFVPLHLPTYSGSAIAIAAFMVIVFVASAVLGYVYERTGNLAINALIHGLYNAALAISAYLALVV